MKKRSFSAALVLSFMIGSMGSTTSHAEEPNIYMNKNYHTPSFIIENWEMPKLPSLFKTDLTKEEIAYLYLQDKQEDFRLDGNMKDYFTVTEEIKDREEGTYHIRLVEQYEGIPLYGSSQTITITDQNTVKAFFGQVVPDLESKSIPTSAKISKEVAKEKAISAIENKIGEVQQFDADPSSELFIYEFEGTFHLTFLVKASTSIPEPGYWHYFIDAESGEIVDSFNAIDQINGFGHGIHGDKRTFDITLGEDGFYLFDGTRGEGVHTFDAENVDPFVFNLFSQWFGYSGEEVKSGHKFFKDPAAVDAHTNASIVYDYYKNTFNRDSFDGEGAKLISSVHVGDNWNNAAWNGVQMMYGDGDGEVFLPLSGALDVIGHELTHAVTDRTADLVYQGESGALNESISDILGAMTDRDDWLMGEDIFTPGIEGDGLRSLKDPSSIPHPFEEGKGYPDHYSELYTGELDNGGVHINSSINNKAAYLLSEGGTHHEVTVKGIGRDATEQIYYRALTKYLTATSDFYMMRQAAIESAKDIYGEFSQEVESVKQAYDSVGVY